ncbi:SGNH/GDSL hydrolase family protein [Advenella sp. S44]|uniref:SGNH/GDSL hydrolase family protein n=1 Tax=Advenella sp. S44 TaxID=1982755 RepID=UPI0012904897|nr:SGNH/GDSL hydrolase family protein [Advenella sp. S44]
MKKRLIRLKEQEPLTRRVHTPTESYKLIRPTLDRYLSYASSVNDDGFMISGNYIESSQKIFLLGGSFIENMYTSQNQRIHSELEKILLNRGYLVEVLNSGVSGSTSLNLLNVVLNKIVPYAPCTILFCISINDTHALSFKAGFWNKYKLFSTLNQASASERTQPDIAKENLSQLKNVYRTLKELCKFFNINLLVANTPFINEIDDSFYVLDNNYYRKMCEKRSLIYDTLYSMFRSEGFDSLDLHEAMGGNKKLFFDDVHTNAEGSCVVASVLASRLEKYLKKSDDPPRLSVYRSDLNSINLTVDMSWSSKVVIPSDMSKFSHAILEYELDCGADAIENNALLCLKFEHENYSFTDVGLKYSDNVGLFSYLSTGPRLLIQDTVKFNIPAGAKELQLGFRLWRKRTEVKLLKANLNLFFF